MLHVVSFIWLRSEDTSTLESDNDENHVTSRRHRNKAFPDNEEDRKDVPVSSKKKKGLSGQSTPALFIWRIHHHPFRAYFIHRAISQGIKLIIANYTVYFLCLLCSEYY